MSSAETENAIVREIPLKWDVPDGLSTHFATNMVVSHTQGEFFITFFEVVPPVLLGSVERLRAIEEVEAKAVCRVAISADRMPGFIDAMQRNLENYRKKKELVPDVP